MTRAPLTPEARYAALVQSFLDDTTLADVSGGGPKRKFGDGALKVRGKIFAMLAQGTLVVKLPRERVDALVNRGGGKRFDPGHGRVMKEWIAIASTSPTVWRALAREAMAYAARR